MRIAVFADMHACIEAMDAVLSACDGVDELWSLGDMVGTGPDPGPVVARVRSECRIALLGNHDYLALRDVPAHASIEHARAVLSDDLLAWMRSRKPASRVGTAIQMWHGGPHNAVHEFVGPANAAACLELQRAPLGLVGHTHVAAAFSSQARRGVAISPGRPLDITRGKWLLNCGAVFMPSGLASWLLLDLRAGTATWMQTPFDPGPAAERARRLGFGP
jgi:predicted phosphodiesterase